METKRFIGNDMPRIYARVKREYGPDAVILRTRSLYREGAEPLIEVIAAPPEGGDGLPLEMQSTLIAGALKQVLQPNRGLTIGDLEDLAAREEEQEQRRAAALEAVREEPGVAPDWLEGFVGAAVSAPGAPLTTAPRRAGSPPLSSAFTLPDDDDLQAPPADWASRPRPAIVRRRTAEDSVVPFASRRADEGAGQHSGGLMERFRDAGFSPEAAHILARQAGPGDSAGQALARYLESRDVRYPDEQHTSLLSIQGAVSGGRTTALMRMALDCADSGRATLLVAADGVHVAAREQVRAYGEAIGLEAMSTFEPHEIIRAATRASTGSCLFIDTPPGPWQAPPISGIPHFAYLALPAHWSRATLDAALRGFSMKAFAGVVLTFTDLATDLTPVVSLLVESGLGIAFLSSSRDVSTGIEVADPLMLASGIFAPATRESTNGRLFATA